MIGPAPRDAPGSTGAPASGRPWSRWADSVSDALPDGHVSLEAIVAFVDDELPSVPARRAAEHVGRCLSCAVEVANQRQARHRLRDADAPGAPSSLLSTLRAIPELPDLPGTTDPGARGPAAAPSSFPDRLRRLGRPGP